VARIAYLSSDVIVSVQPAQAVESEFSSHLRRYAGRKDPSLVATADAGVPEVLLKGKYRNNLSY
jgi:sulfite reductase (NADPH) hemoprotein beta-component